MNNHILSQQDFFIYVPTLKPTLKKNNSSVDYLKEVPMVAATQTPGETLPVGYEDWVQIPFSDALVVYACIM